MSRAYQQSDTTGQLLNAFPIMLPAGATLTYRIWNIDPEPATEAMREKIRSYLWHARLRRPVFTHLAGERFGYAVADWGRQQPVEYIGDGEKRYLITPTNDRRTVVLDRMQGLDGFEAELSAAMLQQELILQLGADERLSRDHRNDRFLLMQPDSPYAVTRRSEPPIETLLPSPAINIYRGFTFRVAHFQHAGLCLVLDIVTSYIGQETLATYLARGAGMTLLKERGLGVWVNDYGRVKQSVYLVDVPNRSINEVMLRDGRTIYAYLRAVRSEVRDVITPTDRAATVVYDPVDMHNESRHYTAATTLLRPRFAVEHPDVRRLCDTPAFPPEERLRRIETMRDYFQGLRFADQPITLGPAVRLPNNMHPLPSLLFGPPEQPVELQLTTDHDDERATRARWGHQKFAALRANGPYRRAPFVNPYFVYPAGLEDNGLLDAFLTQTRAFCEQYGNITFDPLLSSYRDESLPRDIINKLKGIAASQRTGFILLALPENAEYAGQVYIGLKTQVGLPSKCFASAKLHVARSDPRAFAAYVDRNALGMLLENGTRPWSLAHPLAYELQFGFDVARTRRGGLMGAAVIADPHDNIIFDYQEVDSPERIPARAIGTFVLNYLEHFRAMHGRAPRSILFQRSGYLPDAERRGLRAALRKFAEAHADLAAPLWTAIAISKANSVPLRILGFDGAQIVRPLSGSYVVQDHRVGYIVLTGDPGARQGTPRPLRVEVVESNQGDQTEIVEILRDIFWLSQLNWSFPEVDIRLPITLRFANQKLERYALEQGEDGIEREWDEPAQDEDDSGDPGSQSRRNVATIS
jgi:hypothetical protein